MWKSRVRLLNIKDHRQTDRYFIDREEVITDLFVIEWERDICIYKIVTCKKSCDNIHGMTYISKIMLSVIAIIKKGYFDNTNDKLLLKIKFKAIAKIT